MADNPEMTFEQKIHFDSFIDIMASLIEKYGPEVLAEIEGNNSVKLKNEKQLSIDKS